jgi:CubicO group peptidase (beta-lactamase class C family)
MLLLLSFEVTGRGTDEETAASYSDSRATMRLSPSTRIARRFADHALVLSLALSAPLTGGAQANMDSSARIARVISSLHPAALDIEGRPVELKSLVERMAQHHVPGVSIAVIDGGRISWARGFGVKDAGAADSVSATTLFQAKSISKPIAATATLRLVEQGTLDLDTDVNRYLTSWKVPENDFTTREKVTLRRILSHSAGLTVHGFPGYAADAQLPSVVQVLDGAKPANTEPVRVEAIPGAVGNYSGGGVTIEQLLLTDVTHRNLPDLVRELVLVPEHITLSSYEQPPPRARESEAAHAHARSGAPIAGRWHVYPEMAAAGLWTTPSDLLRWAMAIDSARAGKPGAILSKKMTQQMLTEQKYGFGLGPEVAGKWREFRYGHSGGNAGFISRLVYFPETGQGAAIMTNGDGGAALIPELLRALATEYHWPALAPERRTAVALDSMTIANLLGDYDIGFGKQQVAHATRAR